MSIPADDWARPCSPVEPRTIGTATRADADVLAAITAALDASQRPALVVGAGVDRGGAWDEVRALAERYRARVFTAPMSSRCGFAEDHPLFAGFLPAMREKIVDLLGGSDVVLALGAPTFTYHVEGFGPHLPPARAVPDHRGPRARRLGAGRTAAVGDVRLAARELLDRAAPVDRPMPRGRTPAPRAEPSSPMSVAFALQTLAEVRRPEHVIVEEAPSSRPVMHRHLPMLQSETFYTMASGGLGFGLAAAVGVALAKPGSRVIGLVGDGSAMYSIQALWSAAQLKLPMTFVSQKRRYAALRVRRPSASKSARSSRHRHRRPRLRRVGARHGSGRVARARRWRRRRGAALDGPALVEVVA